jgi:hypothetical protein
MVERLLEIPFLDISSSTASIFLNPHCKYSMIERVSEIPFLDLLSSKTSYFSNLSKASVKQLVSLMDEGG